MYRARIQAPDQRARYLRRRPRVLARLAHAAAAPRAGRTAGSGLRRSIGSGTRLAPRPACIDHGFRPTELVDQVIARSRDAPSVRSKIDANEPPALLEDASR